MVCQTTAIVLLCQWGALPFRAAGSFGVVMTPRAAERIGPDVERTLASSKERVPEAELAANGALLSPGGQSGAWRDSNVHGVLTHPCALLE